MKIIKNTKTQFIEFGFNDNNVSFIKGDKFIEVNGSKWTVNDSSIYEEIVVEGQDLPSNFVPHLFWWVNSIVESPLYVTLWQNVRKERNRLLVESDWTQLADVALTNKAEWDTYRQILRDITTQINPFAIEWPEKP